MWRLLGWTVLGGLLLGAGMAAWQGLQLDAQLDAEGWHWMLRLPPEVIAMEVLRLHLWAGLGAAAGFVVGTCDLCWRGAARMRWRARQALIAEELAARDAAKADPDALIREAETRRANAYLASRDAGDPPPPER